MARQIPDDLGALAKAITGFEVKTSSDVRELVEHLRAFHMDVAEVCSVAEKEIYDALRWLDGGKFQRARGVTRPLRHAQSFSTLAARRCVQTWRLYCKLFAEEIRPQRDRGTRRMDPTK